MKKQRKPLLLFILFICFCFIVSGCRDSSIEPEELLAKASTGSVVPSSSPSVNNTELTVQNDKPNSKDASSTASNINQTPAQSMNSSLDSSSANEALAEIDKSLNLKGKVLIDGSAMMSPISERIAEAFRKVYSSMEIGVAISGTEEGIQSFIKGKIDICNTSRALRDDEAAAAKSKGVDFIDLKVAYDGIVLAVNKSNPVNTININEIKGIFSPDSTIMNWKEANPKWPDLEMMIFGPKSDTGLIEFFCTKVLETKKGEIGSYSEAENEKELAKSIAGDNTALGILSFSDFFANKDKLKALKVDSGQGAVLPGIDTIKNGSYKALSSPMHLYISKNSLKREEVKVFVKYYLENASKIVLGAGYVPVSDADYKTQAAMIK